MPTVSPSRRTRERRERTLRPVRPSAGTQAVYQRRMDALVREMQDSYEWWVRAAYRKQQPRIVDIAQDASPVEFLASVLGKLARRWERKFDTMARRMAEHFALSVDRRTAGTLERAMRDAGWSVPVVETEGIRAIRDAVVRENVALIKSIPQQYHTQVEGIVMRGVTSGRDLGAISADLRKRYGVTKRRAALIARDQSNKATAAFSRTRAQEAGLREAVWVHSGGGKEPRRTHLKAGREKTRYRLDKGWFDPDPKVKAHIHPGFLINCRCVSRPVVPGFE